MNNILQAFRIYSYSTYETFFLIYFTRNTILSNSRSTENENNAEDQGSKNSATSKCKKDTENVRSALRVVNIWRFE